MDDRIPNSQYNLAAPDSLPIRLAGYQRRCMYERFLQETDISAEKTILDVGVTSDRSYSSSNYLEAWYPHKAALTAVGIEDASFLEHAYPGMRFLNANGLSLPFQDQAFDIVHSSAVLEHVGSFENQIRFVRECARVARVSFFLTTPNRWFPMEFHTVLPFVHWLPKRLFRAVMRRTGFAFFAEEANLNLLTVREIDEITGHVDGFDLRISSVALGGWPSNLLLVGRRLAESV